MDDFRRANPLIYQVLKQYAKEMRKNPTLAESFLWDNLKRNALGMGFKRQSVILDYIADFYCPERELIIEVDGGYHIHPEQEELDEQRSQRLEKMGYQILRFSNEQVLFDIENVLRRIDEVLYQKQNIL